MNVCLFESFLQRFHKLAAVDQLILVFAMTICKVLEERQLMSGPVMH